ncbi:unnamed protein product [marine sediment metagenome]|uniref:Uncharacterized protein n=1 Tax=marine sediment metagenome TaxID=412755 RepID=X1TJA9_9ZZZZ
MKSLFVIIILFILIITGRAEKGTDEYEWTGFIPFEELPWVFNPSKGYIATANNHIVSESYPYVLETEYDHSGYY